MKLLYSGLNIFNIVNNLKYLFKKTLKWYT